MTKPIQVIDSVVVMASCAFKTIFKMVLRESHIDLEDEIHP